jgi:hypothetical protein
LRALLAGRDRGARRRQEPRPHHGREIAPPKGLGSWNARPDREHLAAGLKLPEHHEVEVMRTRLDGGRRRWLFRQFEHGPEDAILTSGERAELASGDLDKGVRKDRAPP